MDASEHSTTIIYPQQVERALEINIIELAQSTANMAIWSPDAHPKRYAYWRARNDKLRRKRRILLNMRDEGMGAPYVRQGPPELP